MSVSGPSPGRVSIPPKGITPVWTWVSPFWEQGKALHAFLLGSTQHLPWSRGLPSAEHHHQEFQGRLFFLGVACSPDCPEEHKWALFPPHCSLALHFSQLLLTSSSPCWLESWKLLISTSFDKQEVGKKSIIFRIRASEWIEERKGEEGKKRKRALHTFLIAR